MKWIAPLLLFLGTLGGCLGMLESALQIRGAVEFVRPYHYGVMLAAVGVSVAVFWPLYRRMSGRGAIVTTLAFLAVLLLIWAIALPMGDRLAALAQLQAADGPLSPEEIAWFYPGDSGMGRDPMQLWHLQWVLMFRPWWVALFLAFLPIFFGFHRRLSDISEEMRQLPLK